MKLFYPLRPGTTAVHPNFFAGNSQNIVWVCINDLLESGFKG